MVKKTIKEIFKTIRLDLIDEPEEIVRMDIDQKELNELAESIKERGLMQPIGVTPRGKRFMIVYGHRRYLAHKILIKKDIICRVEEIDDKQIAVDRAMENLQRVNLTPFEEGHLYANLREKAGMSIEEISKKIRKSPGVIHRRMDILRMPDSFQQALHKKQISIAVAEELWSCKDGSKREYFLELAVEHGITRDIARAWVQDFNKQLRNITTEGGGGGLETGAFEELPIYRACDLCRNPAEYKDTKNLIICPECHKRIKEAIKEVK